MKFKHAEKLHNGDQVTVKNTEEVVTVINTQVENKNVYIETVTSENGYTTLNHKEIL